jgi:hypothetical protein
MRDKKVKDRPRAVRKDHNLHVIRGVTLMAVLGSSSVSPAFPKMVAELGVSTGQVGLLIIRGSWLSGRRDVPHGPRFETVRSAFGRTGSGRSGKAKCDLLLPRGSVATGGSNGTTCAAKWFRESDASWWGRT